MDAKMELLKIGEHLSLIMAVFIPQVVLVNLAQIIAINANLNKSSDMKGNIKSLVLNAQNALKDII